MTWSLSQSLGGSGAPGEGAGEVAFGGLGGEPVGDLVLRDVEVLGQVDHRLDGHLGQRGPQPRADLLDGDDPAGPYAWTRANGPSGERWTWTTVCRERDGRGVGCLEVQ